MELEGKAKGGSEKVGARSSDGEKEKGDGKWQAPQKYCEFLMLGHLHETDMEMRFRAEAESCRVTGHKQRKT